MSDEFDTNQETIRTFAYRHNLTITDTERLFEKVEADVRHGDEVATPLYMPWLTPAENLRVTAEAEQLVRERMDPQ